MDDRTLLEMAARSAGVDVHQSDDGTIQCRPILAVYHYVQGQPFCELEWNPLKDDAACFRMEVALSISTTFMAKYVFSQTDDGIPHIEYFKNHSGDRNAARRRASTRAAAALGDGK